MWRSARAARLPAHFHGLPRGKGRLGVLEEELAASEPQDGCDEKPCVICHDRQHNAVAHAQGYLVEEKKRVVS